MEKFGKYMKINLVDPATLFDEMLVDELGTL